MTEEEIMDVWTYISGKSEGLFESGVKCNFPVMFTEAILKLDRMNREWVGLTLDEINSFAHGSLGRQALCCAIEAKLKEKNNGAR